PGDVLVVYGPTNMGLSPLAPPRRLTFTSGSDATLNVAPFYSGPVGLPRLAAVTVDPPGTVLDADIPGNTRGLTSITVKDKGFADALQQGDTLVVFPTVSPDISPVGPPLHLAFISSSGTTINVAPFDTGAIDFPRGASVTVQPLHDALAAG